MLAIGSSYCACDPPFPVRSGESQAKIVKRRGVMCEKWGSFPTKPGSLPESAPFILFCVEESFDGALGRLLKLLFVELYADDLFVGIDHRVEHAAVFLHSRRALPFRPLRSRGG